MMRLFIILPFLLVFGTIDLSAQGKPWTLKECIDYAIENNIGLQRQRLQTETARINYLQSKMTPLPTLNAGSEAQLGFGRSIDPVTNLITFEQNLSNYYYVSSELTLFKGFATLNTISANKFMLLAGLEQEKIARNTLIVDVMGQYYQVIYAKGLENSSRVQLDLSEKQLFRITKLVETGREALSKQYELESTASADRLAYTTAHNSASQAVTTLRQMLQVDPETEFDVLLPDLNTILITDNKYKTDSIFNIAMEVLPSLKSISYELKAAKRQLASARGNIYPSLTAGGSIFTGYYKLIGSDSEGQLSFNDQLKNNNSQSISLSLNIPLFNNYITGKNIKLAKIRQKDTELRLQTEKNSLYSGIENACLNYNSGKDEYMAAMANLEFNKKSFNGVEKKFETGLVDVTGYSVAKTALFKSENEVLRTKLQLLIRELTIQLYSTGEYENLVIN
jgi:outer membrane protein